MVETMASALLEALSRATTPAPITPAPAPAPAPTDIPTRVNNSVKRQFPGMFQPREAKRGKGRFCSPARTPPPPKTIDMSIYVLPRPADVTPKGSQDLLLSRAGLGRRLLTVSEDNNHSEIVSLVEKEFSKVQPLEGRWMFYKATGGSGQRKLMVVPLDAEGYTGRQLKSASNNGKNVIFLAPVQEELDTEPLPYNSAEFARMPQVACLVCNHSMPLQMLTLHAENCTATAVEQEDVVTVYDDEEDTDHVGTAEEQGVCPVCDTEFLISELPDHASLCAECSYSNVPVADMEVPGPSHPRPSQALRVAPDWKTAETPIEAMKQFLGEVKEGAQHLPPLQLSLDAGDNDEERDSTLISFYKQRRDKSQWAAPFNCRIIGDAAVGLGVVRHILSSSMSKLKQGFKKNMASMYMDWSIR
ncbi:uncharacterized protein LOC134099994 [Sardina pilchardus]|uniref:uncharacterized protein LOC134099994 n=1 Tax=Sardina pilchardus TaxID=27697 RepID=UPI002E1203C2